MQSQMVISGNEGSGGWPKGLSRTICAILLGIFLAGLPGLKAIAQPVVKSAVTAAPQAVPGFWDPRRRPDRPDLSRITMIRFLTETDYPPFDFTGSDGNPAGFNVDFARALCEEIKVPCTIQMRRFVPREDAHHPRRGEARGVFGDARAGELALNPKTQATRPGWKRPTKTK